MDDTITYACRNRRRNMTPAQTLFWKAVRRNNIGIKIDRQKAVYLKKQESGDASSIIADFLSIEHKLIIEIQSSDTAERDEYELDTKKDKLLEQQGYTILRFTDAEVIEDIEKVIERIKGPV